MKNLIYLLVFSLIFILTSCSKDNDTKTVRPKKEKQTSEQEMTEQGSSPKEDNLTSKESELKQKELELKEKELQLEEEKMRMERERNTNPPPQNKKRYGSVPGDFPEGSTRYLSYNDVAGLSKWQLSVMRNEIYARHGYIFTQNMAIKNHFERQSWYVPMYYNVDGFLTKTEKYNINFIKQYE
jgi:hypothetical protein